MARSKRTQLGDLLLPYRLRLGPRANICARERRLVADTRIRWNQRDRNGADRKQVNFSTRCDAVEIPAEGCLDYLDAEPREVQSRCLPERRKAIV